MKDGESLWFEVNKHMFCIEYQAGNEYEDERADICIGRYTYVIFGSYTKLIDLLLKSEPGTKIGCEYENNNNDYIVIRKNVITFYYDGVKEYKLNKEDFRLSLSTELLLGE